jgi:hypothetical protein
MSLDNALWLALILIEAAVVGLLFYRGIWRNFPVFCAYCVWDILSNAATYIINQYYPRAYFTAYFVQAVTDSALEIGVLVELAWSVLRPIRASLSRSALVVVAALILVAGAIIWPFAGLPGLAHITSKAGLLFLQMQQTVSILRILLFLILAAGSQLLSISWRDRELQVATGLGFYSIVCVAATVLQAHEITESQFYHLNQLVVVGFLFSLLYWLVSFAQKEVARREFTPEMQNFLLAVAGAAHSTRVALTESRASKAGKHERR